MNFYQLGFFVITLVLANLAVWSTARKMRDGVCDSVWMAVAVVVVFVVDISFVVFLFVSGLAYLYQYLGTL